MDNYHLGIVDYTILLLLLVISAAIGIAFKFYGDKQTTLSEYLLAGKNMWRLPVIVSIVATMTSPVSFLGTAAEVYKYGLQNVVAALSVAFGMVITANLLVPVYFQCGVSTIYEIMYMSTVLYAPVLTLSAVTDLSLEAGILVFGTICSMYCAMGGLKAVLWTDVFQSILMVACIVAIYVAGIMDSGGIANVYNRAYEGGRLILFETTTDITKRYTLWNCIVRGVLYGIGGYGANQTEVQRMLSMKNVKRAKSTLLFSIAPVVLMYTSCNIMGVVLYSVFYNCDPILDKEHTGIRRHDQLLPYYIVRRFSTYPGMTGLCIAGIFSCSLSTVSSVLNSLATVTVIDFVRPIKPNFSDSKTVMIAKGLSLLYGAVCIMFSFVLSKMSSIKGAAATFYSIAQAPLTAVFLIGVLTRKVTYKSVLFGLCCSIILSGGVGFNSLFYRYREPPLPLSISSCPSENNSSLTVQSSSYNCTSFANCTNTENLYRTESSFALGKISYMWIDLIGFGLTIILTFIAHLVTGSKNNPESDPRCLSPVMNLWTRKPIRSVELKDKRANEIELNESHCTNELLK